jgi:hypothetical protein
MDGSLQINDYALARINPGRLLVGADRARKAQRGDE